MKVTKFESGTNLGDPGAAAWSKVPAERVALGPAPVEAQPNAYIRTKWASGGYGTTAEAALAVASDGQRLYVRIEWDDDAAPNVEFPDAAAVVLGNGGQANPGTFGANANPVTVWYWEDGRGEALNLVAEGPGVFRKQANGDIRAAANLANGRWQTVLSGPASAAASGQLGVAVWNGSNEERAGLGAVSQAWIALELA
ncbi:MAG: hypothetical protein Kow0010_01590 [Dehalococcoidia bacterium]